MMRATFVLLAFALPDAASSFRHDIGNVANIVRKAIDNSGLIKSQTPFRGLSLNVSGRSNSSNSNNEDVPLLGPFSDLGKPFVAAMMAQLNKQVSHVPSVLGGSGAAYLRLGDLTLGRMPRDLDIYCSNPDSLGSFLEEAKEIGGLAVSRVERKGGGGSTMRGDQYLTLHIFFQEHAQVPLEVDMKMCNADYVTDGQHEPVQISRTDSIPCMTEAALLSFLFHHGNAADKSNKNYWAYKELLTRQRGVIEKLKSGKRQRKKGGFF